MDEFFQKTLPDLALNYRREALNTLEDECPWLKAFRLEEADLNDARKYFFENGTDCISQLEKHANFTWLAITNAKLTDDFGILYPVFAAKIYQRLEVYEHETRNDDRFFDDVLARSSRRLELEENEIERQNVSNQYVDSFWDAAKAIQSEKVRERAIMR